MFVDCIHRVPSRPRP